MSIIEAVRNYFITFPDLPEGAVQIDYLGDEATQFTLEAVPCEPVYRQYVDGGCLRQFLFVFASRSYFGADVALCAENQALFEHLSDWVYTQDMAGTLPDLGEGKRAVALQVTSSGYVLSEDAKTARYQMQLRLIYEEIRNEV